MSCWLTYHDITSSPVSLRHDPACVCFALNIPLPEEVAGDVLPSRPKFVFSFVTSRQHVTSRLPLDGFLLGLRLETSTKIGRFSTCA
jgi:hypothetical protein